MLKATYEAFEAVLGSRLGNRLWKYAIKVELEEGEIICREGEMNQTLYLLQTGKVSSYRYDESLGDIRRLHTITRGAFMNDECLFLNHPVTYSSLADEDSVVWAVDRDNFLDMQANEPYLAMEVMRAVMRHSSEVCSLSLSVCLIHIHIYSLSCIDIGIHAFIYIYLQ